MSNSDNPNLENLLQLGISAAREGRTEGARVYFQQVLAEDKKNERAWIWMAYVAENDIKRRQYLETVLKVNPKNKTARTALKKIAASRSTAEQRTLVLGMVVVMAILVIAALLCLVALLGSG